jgi:alpha-tubulin suppressor-like RCC1 family protein
LTLPGRVACWGHDGVGQLGRDTPSGPTARADFVRLPDGVRAREIAAGDWHTCAIVGADAVYCWGANDRGQLGRPPPADRFAPAGVAWP